MRDPFFSFFFLSLSAVANPASPRSTRLHCEATPVEHDNTLSLFCQEDDFNPNSTSAPNKTSSELPDLSASLDRVVFTTDSNSDENEPLEGNHIQNDTFASVDPKNVSDLSVWAKFDTIPDEAFAKFSNLRQLHIAQFYDNASRVVAIKDQAFHGLTQLEWLGLHCNFSHQSIPKAILGIQSLVSLGFYESELTSDFAVGSSWPKLRLLTIYDSPNMSLANNAFENLRDTLTDVDFSNIQMDKFPKALTELRNLSRVEIAVTGLQEVPPDAFANSASSITIIRLSRNRISVLHPTSFRGLTKLQVLQLAYNQIEVIPASLFDDLVALEVLNLAGNKIKTLPALIFDHNKRLQILDLDENPINASASQYLKGQTSSGGMDYGSENDDDDNGGSSESPGRATTLAPGKHTNGSRRTSQKTTTARIIGSNPDEALKAQFGINNTTATNTGASTTKAPASGPDHNGTTPGSQPTPHRITGERENSKGSRLSAGFVIVAPIIVGFLTIS